MRSELVREYPSRTAAEAAATNYEDHAKRSEKAEKVTEISMPRTARVKRERKDREHDAQTLLLIYLVWLYGEMRWVSVHSRFFDLSVLRSSALDRRIEMIN